MKKTLIAAGLGATFGALVAVVALAQQASPAYVLAQLNIHDRETYSKYEAEFGPIFLRHGGHGTREAGPREGHGLARGPRGRDNPAAP